MAIVPLISSSGRLLAGGANSGGELVITSGVDVPDACRDGPPFLYPLGSLLYPEELVRSAEGRCSASSSCVNGSSAVCIKMDP